MAVKIVQQDAWRRGVEKGVSRELDSHLLSYKERSVSDMAVDNDVFACLSLSGFRVSAIGGRALPRVDD